jgi:hypothetical protein
MGQEPEPIEVPIKDYDDLVGKLYEIAVKYRDSFDGMAVCHDAGAEIFAAVQDDKGQRQRYVFTNPNPSSMRSLWRSLDGSGYLEGSLILHEGIIRDVNEYLERRRLEKESAKAAEDERRRLATTESAKDRREGRRWWASLLVQSGVAIAAAIITAVLADYYSSRSLSGRVNDVERDVASLKATTQPAPLAGAGPASRPASRP